jgi:hypothetical protein
MMVRPWKPMCWEHRTEWVVSLLMGGGGLMGDDVENCVPCRDKRRKSRVRAA